MNFLQQEFGETVELERDLVDEEHIGEQQVFQVIILTKNYRLSILSEPPLFANFSYIISSLSQTSPDLLGSRSASILI